MFLVRWKINHYLLKNQTAFFDIVEDLLNTQKVAYSYKRRLSSGSKEAKTHQYFCYPTNLYHFDR